MRRIKCMFEPYSLADTGIDFPKAFVMLRKIRKHDACRVVKTWVNSWATSTRYHEATIFPCLFGCSCGEDRQSHYAQCPLLYTILLQLRPHDISACPLTRLGLVSPSRDALLTVSCVFAGYHAIKRSSFVSGLTCLPLSNQQRAYAHILFAEAFRAAALEVQLSCTAHLVAI